MFGKLGKNAVKISVLFFIVIALIVGVAVPVLAADTTTTTSAPPILQPVQGTVVSISGTTSFTIQDANQKLITIKVDADTKYLMAAAGGNKSASFSDIAVGDKIMAMIDSGNTAKGILITEGPVIK